MITQYLIFFLIFHSFFIGHSLEDIERFKIRNYNISIVNLIKLRFKCNT